MEVIYKEDISDKIIKAVRSRTKGIDYIRLTKEEAVELYLIKFNKLESSQMFKTGKQIMCEQINNSNYHGVTLKVSGY